MDADTFKFGVTLIELVKNWPVAIGGMAVATVGVALGVLPRVGPGRALVLAYKSRLFFAPQPPSVRAVDKDRLLSAMEKVKVLTDRYIVVEGPRAVGKTTLVGDVFSHAHGLVEVEVKPASSSETIETNVYRELTGLSTLISDLRRSAVRVVKWHQRFGKVLRFPDPRPTVVLHVQERTDADPNRGEPQDFADVPAAARSLVAMGLRVVIDSMTNALSPTTLQTTREEVVSVDPMTREEVENIESIKAIFDKLRERQLDQVVWNIIGGVPTILLNLRDVLKEGAVVEEVVEKLLRAKLDEAWHVIRQDRHDWKSVFAEFEAIWKNQIHPPPEGIEAKPVPKCLQIRALPEEFDKKSVPKCLRFMRDPSRLVPASAAHAFLLQHGLWREVQEFRLADLKTLCGSTSPSMSSY